jgi:long-chain fatty acid transport protein
MDLTGLASERSRYTDNRLRQMALWLCLGFGILGAKEVRGLGVQIPNQDPEAIGRGNAFAATADNPSDMYYNPAGITQLPGQNAQIGVLNYFGINTTYDSPAGTHSQSDFKILPVPQLGYTLSLQNAPVSFGLGVYAPFGLGVEWPDDTGFRSIAIAANLQYFTVNPVVAWKVHRTFSVAVGPTLNYSIISLKRGLITSTDDFQFKGRGSSVGFNAGLLWQPLDQWSFGATYRSSSIMKYEGNSTYGPGPFAPAATETDLKYPQIITGGVSFRPDTNWNVEVDVDWADWSSVNTLYLAGTKNIFGADLSLPLNWHGSWFYELGATRYFADGWFASAGYFYSTETTSEADFTPAVPDTDLNVGSLGLGRKGEHWNWAVAGQIIAGPQRTVGTSQPNPFTGQSANGKYQLFVPTISLSVGYHF